MRDVDSADAEARAQIPASVLVVKDFVNTADLAARTDLLDTPSSLGSWLVRSGILSAVGKLDQHDLDRALTVREGFRQLLLAHAGHQADPDLVEELNSALAGAPLGVRFGPAGDRNFVAAGTTDLDEALGRLLAAVDDAITAGVWTRLKVCAKDTCRWAYYDGSRNRSGRWCSMTDCGNQVKMKRAYAARTQRPAQR